MKPGFSDEPLPGYVQSMAGKYLHPSVDLSKLEFGPLLFLACMCRYARVDVDCAEAAFREAMADSGSGWGDPDYDWTPMGVIAIADEYICRFQGE